MIYNICIVFQYDQVMWISCNIIPPVNLHDGDTQG